MRRFLSPGFRAEQYLGSLVVATVAYFVAARLVQDWLARRTPLSPAAQDIFPIYPVLPEPYETPLYLAGYIVIPLVALGLAVLWARFVPSLKSCRLLLLGVAVVAVAGGLAVLIARLNVPRIATYLASRELTHVLWLLFTKRIFVLWLAFLVAGAFFVSSYVFWERPSLDRFRSALLNWRPKCLWPWVAVALALLIFTPNFPYEAGHYNYYLAPLNDMFHGKALLYETTSQYGLLSVYVVAALFVTVLPLGYATLSFIFSASYFLFYLGIYAALWRWFHSKLYSLIGLAAVLAVQYYLQVDPFRSAVRYPGLVPLRNGFFVVVLLALLAHLARPTKFRREVTIFLAALAPFWAVDAGMYAFLATFIVFAYAAFFGERQRPVKERALVVASVGLRFVAYAAAIFAAINLVNFVIYGSWPRWSLLLAAFSWYNTGYGKLPMPAVGVFELYVFVYAAAFAWIAYRTARREPVSLPFVFVTIFGIFSFLYYVGNSAWGNIPPVSAPFVLVLLGFAWEFLFQARTDEQPMFARLWWSGMVFVGFLLAVKIPMDVVGRDYVHAMQNRTQMRNNELDVAADAVELRRRFPQTERLPVFHLRDGELLIFARRSNYFDIYDTLNVISRSRLAELVRVVAERKPEYLIIGKQRDMRIQAFVDGVRGQYGQVESLRTLDIYRRTAP